jgi:CRP-like cAMP-binding protein
MQMKKKARSSGRRKHLLTERLITLSASALAQKIGYLRAEDFPSSHIFDTIPTQSFSPHRLIRCEDKICLVTGGLVEVWHTQHDFLIKKLTPGALFGEMSLLGQTMLVTKAISGDCGATLAVMGPDAAREWLEADSSLIVERLGQRLTYADEQHYRALFQTVDSRIAAFLLRLAGGGTTVEGLTQSEIGEALGTYRETVAHVLNAMKLDRLIELGRMRIKILDKRALRELSEL